MSETYFDMAATIHQYFGQMSLGNVESVLELFEEDAVGVYPPMPSIEVEGGVVSGKDNLRTFYNGLVTKFTSQRAKAGILLGKGLSWATPLHFEGVLAQTGGVVSFDNINYWEMSERGLIKTLRVYSGGGPTKATFTPRR